MFRRFGVLFFVAILGSACSGASHEVVGHWAVDPASINELVKTNKQAAAMATAFADKIFIDIRADHTFTFTAPATKMDGTYSVSGTTIELTAHALNGDSLKRANTQMAKAAARNQEMNATLSPDGKRLSISTPNNPQNKTLDFIKSPSN